MAYIPTNEDYALLEQPSLIYYIKIEIRDNGKTVNENTTIIDQLEGILVGGNTSISADSDVRRTASITIVPVAEGNIAITNGVNNVNTFDLTERSKIWLNKNSVLYLGLQDIRTDEIVYYKMGTFVFQSQDITYDPVTNQMSITAADLMTWLDGTINGTIGSLTTLIPAYQEDPVTGEVISRSVIRDAMISVLRDEGNVGRYIIDDIGEYKGLKQYNPSGYIQYRNMHPTWDNVPYDLEFSTGCSVTEIIDSLRDLYPQNETFFDVDGVFRCQAIPSLYHDDISIPDHMLQRYVMSENTNRDFTAVRNVSEVWGQILDTDYYSEYVENVSGVYSATISGYEDEYKNGDRVALKVPSTNNSAQSININSFGNVVIYNVTTDEPIAAGTLTAGEVYVFLLSKDYINGQEVQRFYLQGKWQTHAMAVLTDGTVAKDMWTDPETKIQYPLYSMEYFKRRYNCETVEFMVNPESPFTIQKIGVRLAAYSGGEYDAIYSDDLAMVRAHYENWKAARLTDNITLTTILMPFLDVNTKVSYRMQNSDEIKQYIIKNVSHDFASLTSTITMMTFYPYYENGSLDNINDAYLTVKGTQKFYSNSYLTASAKNRDQLVQDEIVWFYYHGDYQTCTIGGFGASERIGGKDVSGLPWVVAYNGDSENIRNYLFNPSYKVSNVMVKHRDQVAGQFSYQIKDGNGKVYAIGKNDADGNIRFSSIDTSQFDIGTTTLYATQIKGTDSTIVYDETSFPISIVISDTGTNRVYEAVYDVTYTNRY